MSCVLSQQSHDSSWALTASFRFPQPPALLDLGRKYLQKTVSNSRHYSGRCCSVQKLSGLRDKDEAVCRAEKLLCSTSTLTLGHGD